MKRVKIMLLSFALLAVVGGALAFKARFSTPLCYTTEYIASQKISCPLLTGLQFDNREVPSTFYTTTPVAIVGEETCFTDGNPLPCHTYTTSTFDGVIP